MNIEIIKELVSVSNEKKNTILFFLQPKEQKKLKNTELIDKKSIYLDNKIYLVKKNTLELKYNGKLQYYKNNKLGLQINNNYTIYISDLDNYYIFRNTIKKNNQTLFYQKLLKQLEDL
ncbi:MAG: hypothetical protein CMG74_06750 [Candidatus Marinimicrobia bacterium]|nr:hypothetical protein [Candidatus Neomarinimicrobiota bacterium]|tara:strand:+ start:994 stop:1347 length:354 start_codon:yes stop_codon:yes gene_type:complete